MVRVLKSYIYILALSGLALGSMVACTPASLKNAFSFEKRPTEKPAFSEENIEKTFFVDPQGKPKTFMCGWAAEETSGEIGERWITTLSHASAHCNLQFEITENYLIGKMVNPSFPTNPEKWGAAIRIPISKHYYYEKKRDEYGRETNVEIENDSRSHWSARPMMRLNLAGLSIENWAYAIGITDRTPTIVSVDQVEWDKTRSFLGFSAKVTNNYFGNDVNATFRFNFLKFEHDKTFKKIPYAQSNARFFNALHVMGRLVEGSEQDLWVAHWDLRKTTDLYLDDVPQKYQKVLVNVVESWNNTLQKIGASPKGVKAFKPILSKMKHPFDMRYPAIHWIDDRRLSARSPLGIGQAHADVLNGKIMYGLVVLWGGILDEYVRSYSPVASTPAGASGMGKFPLADTYTSVPKSLLLNPAITDISGTALANLAKANDTAFVASAKSALTEMQAALQSDKVTDDEKAQIRKNIPGLQAQIGSIESNPAIITAMLEDASKQANQMKLDTDSLFGNQTLLQVLGFMDMLNPSEQEKLDQIASEKTKAQLALATKYDREYSSKAMPENSNMFLDEDRTVGDMAEAISASPAAGKRDHDEIVLSVIADLALHEVGHFLGLGHQFKGNIIPDEGTVPSRYIKEMQKFANEKNNFDNFSTVMDYRNGRTEAMTPLGHMKPGPHDELVLRYLYKGEYAAYDPAADEFKFFPVAADGIIPNVTKGFETHYFPACNDMEASFSVDPYCNRWDKGSTAQDIVESYFEYVRDNLTSSLYAFSDARGKNAGMAEAALWYRSLSNFSRVRLFYDEMRRYMRTEPRLADDWNKLRKDEDSLHEFSTACQKDESEIKSEILKRMMKDAKLRDLCLANLKVLAEFKTMIALPDADYPLIDFKNHYIQGGYMAGEANRDWGKFFGTWYQMANTPLKVSALYTLTTASPYLLLGGMYPNPFYNHSDDKYLYMMLFPREYTQIISDTVKYNLQFGNASANATTSIGKSVLALSWMLPMQRYGSNDYKRFTGNYVNMLSIQTQFDLSYSFIVISNVDPEGEDAAKPRNIKRFTATAWEPRANKSLNLSDVYVLPQASVLARANNAFLFPITKMRFLGDKESYVVALKVDFDVPVGDRLYEESVKQSLSNTYDQILYSCINGRNNSGLSAYFDVGKPFKGFYIPPGIAQDSSKHEKMAAFIDSIDTEFANYETWAKQNDKDRSMISTCDEAVRGVSEILSTSALLSGTWIPLITDHLVK